MLTDISFRYRQIDSKDSIGESLELKNGYFSHKKYSQKYESVVIDHTYTPPKAPFVGYSRGENHTLLLDADGKIYGAGDGTEGQVPSKEKFDPVGVLTEKKPDLYEMLLPNNEKATKVVAAGKTSYALSNKGILYSRGDGSKGQLGVGKVTGRKKWSKVDMPEDAYNSGIIKDFTANEYLCILDLGNDEHMWFGSDLYNQVDYIVNNRGKNTQLSPVRMDPQQGITNIKAIHRGVASYDSFSKEIDVSCFRRHISIHSDVPYEKAQTHSYNNFAPGLVAPGGGIGVSYTLKNENNRLHYVANKSDVGIDVPTILYPGDKARRDLQYIEGTSQKSGDDSKCLATRNTADNKIYFMWADGNTINNTPDMFVNNTMTSNYANLNNDLLGYDAEYLQFIMKNGCK